MIFVLTIGSLCWSSLLICVDHPVLVFYQLRDRVQQCNTTGSAWQAGDIHVGDAELQGCEKFRQKLGENEMIEHYLGIILGWHLMASTFPIQVPVVHDALCLLDQISGICTKMLMHVLCCALFWQWNVVRFELCNVSWGFCVQAHIILGSV